MGEDKGLTGLFQRISHLGKGVVFGQTAGILWNLRGFFQNGVPLILKNMAATMASAFG